MSAAGQSSITVAVRVRPFTIREAAQVRHKNDDGTVFLGDGSLAGLPTPKLNQRGIRNVIKVMDGRCLVFDPPEDSPVHRFSRSVVPASKKTKDQVFAFDRVFDDATTQSDVYEGTTKQLLDSVLDGYNATVFAYGATGCGKTHTITGTPQQPGIIFLTMQELFEKIEERSQEKTTELSLSYLEIYNETIRDLLLPGGSKSGLMLREDSNQAVTVPGLTSHHPKDVQEVMDMIVRGNEYRTVSPTEANATSSRSHAVLQINIAQKDRNADVNEPHTMATLSIIDLAGSERASVTKNRGERLTEGANINKSLLALGSCINALCDRRGRAHVPYRNSKLTRLLKFSLGGNCKTVMIVCVSPSSAHYDETQNTLRYANRAKNIQTKVTRNVFNVNRHVKDFLVKIDEQRALIDELRAQQKDAENIFLAKFRKQWEKRNMTTREGVQRLHMAYEHSAGERQERINSMKKLKAFERRIGLLSGWIAAFDAVCDQRGGEDDSMPQNLTAIRKMANGILLELEASRRHIQQKLEKPAWERPIDIALDHGLRQLESSEGTDTGEIAKLEQEAEILKITFNREAYHEVLEHDRMGDAAMVQQLLTAQFEMLTSMTDTLSMGEEEAVSHAKEIIHRLLEVGYKSVSQVVKPDGSLPVVDIFPPNKKGTPKRRKSLRTSFKPVEPPSFAAAAPREASVFTSPMKGSPRRRKVASATKKGISFTPVKKTKGRGVRWRDDESEQGTLEDFEKTPQKRPPTDESLIEQTPPPPVPAPVFEPMSIVQQEPTILEESSPKPEESEAQSATATAPPSGIPAARPGRFQAGFLSKGPRSSTSQGDSPTLNPPTFSMRLSGSPSGSEGRTPPALRSLDVSKMGNLSPSSLRYGFRRSSSSPSTDNKKSTLDENKPPISQATSSGSDSETSMLDSRKLRSAMHNANKAKRVSTMTATATSNAKRTSSIGTLHGDRPAGPRPSMPGSSSYALASTTNGISRSRRGSTDRRRSPPMTCAPAELGERALTAGQARRMNLGGSMRSERTQNNADGRNSPQETRRATIGVGVPPAAAAQKKQADGRASLASR
ncbi:kinesin family member 18/19 [Geosmithia morbida]|uniref:Kinesin family member 18/19 n=1 Tax=Geosmithia morbida TaxID=1094350 RepID=A0A9P4YXT1_9HYPO|nr:kinesin family member 18/19 [Geosmithia morbida]KAF4124830.1 kinesin family member 18/19 [Geosmithia morbida]